ELNRKTVRTNTATVQNRDNSIAALTDRNVRQNETGESVTRVLATVASVVRNVNTVILRHGGAGLDFTSETGQRASARRGDTLTRPEPRELPSTMRGAVMRLKINH